MQNIINIETTYASLRIQGQSLTKLYQAEQKLLKSNTTKMVFNAESFEFKLGKLISEILSVEEVKLIDKAKALKYGINAIDRRRKSEALWLFSNHSNVVTWLKNNPKKRFTSLPSLKNTFVFEHKAEVKPTVEPTKILQLEDKSSVESNVGQSQEAPKVTKKLTASELVFDTLIAMELHGIGIKDFSREFKEQYALLVQEKKVA